jgi:nitronate monooxygenase
MKNFGVAAVHAIDIRRWIAPEKRHASVLARKRVPKKKLLAANENDTVRTTLFGFGWPNAPHRTLRTKFVEDWLGNEARGQESRADEPIVGQTIIGGQPTPLPRFLGFPPNVDATGDLDSMDFLASQGVGLVREIKPAGEIVRELVDEAQEIISRLSQQR